MNKGVLDAQVISKFILDFSRRFSLKHLGALHYFLGVEVIPTPAGLFLSQHKYIRELLERTQMTGAKEVSTSLPTHGSLVLHDGSPPANATSFRSTIGALQYLSITRPDIAYAVNKLSQFMHQPSQLHWAAAKRLLRYGTLFISQALRHSACPLRCGLGW